MECRMPSEFMDRPLGRALAGAAALAMAMGVGRFAYTALLPSVQRSLGFDDVSAGAIASANLVGYLAGVIWARRHAAGPRRMALLRTGLIVSVLTTAAVAGASGVMAWAGLRFASGVASGLVFVLVSTIVLEALPAGGEAIAGVLFAGVGGGIALSGAMAAGTAGVAWSTPWLLLAAVAAALAAPSWSLARPAREAREARPVEHPRWEGESITLGRLRMAYFLEGLGYIVSGTFAVVSVQRTPGLEAWAPWVWAAAGLAAAPSAVLWGEVARRVGARSALVAAFAVQAAGMSLPALSSTAWAALTGALLFGGTFIGIVSLTMSLAGRVNRGRDPSVIGTLTMLYGIGQALGPVLAGALSRATGGPRSAVLAAAIAVGLGGALLAIRPLRPRPETTAGEDPCRT
jgi:MFS family permease